MARPKPHNITPPMDDRQIEAINQNFDALFGDVIRLARSPVLSADTSHLADIAPPSEGAVIIGKGTPPKWTTLPIGVAGQVLTSDGVLPVWQDATAKGYWSPITNGDPESPELLFDSHGDCIVGFVPTP